MAEGQSIEVVHVNHDDFAAINHASIVVEMNKAVGDFGFDPENVVRVDHLTLPPGRRPDRRGRFRYQATFLRQLILRIRARPDVTNLGDLPRIDAVMLDSGSLKKFQNQLSVVEFALGVSNSGNACFDKDNSIKMDNLPPSLH